MIYRFKDFLKEDHAQFEIPFIENKGKKPMHVDFIDALESMHKKMSLISDKSPAVYIEDIIKKINIEKLLSDTMYTNLLYTIIDLYGIDLLSNAYRKEEDIKDISDINLDSLDFSSFNKKGKSFIKNNISNILNVADEYEMQTEVESMYNEDKDGLVTVWRALRISTKLIKDNKANNLYDLMVKQYKGTGQYWTWDESAAESHWGATGSDYIDIILKGKVRTQDIDWERTLFVSVYDLREEKEIRLKPDAFVNILQINFQKDSKKSKTELNLIVPVGNLNSKITEAHAQMELPFNGGKKPIHVDFIDAVEELAVKMQYKTSFDWDSIEQKALKTGVKRALDSIETEETSQEILIQWAELNQKIIDKSLFSERFIKEQNVPDGIIPMDFFYDTDVLHQYGKEGFSEKGWSLLSEQLPTVVTNILNEGWRNERMFNTMHKSFNANNGLIDCWRAIILDDSVDDVFKTVTTKYKGVGLYWSWSQGAAHPYNGKSNLSSRVDAILHAKVRAEDVDWARTVYVNVYDLREEQEISIKGHVQLDYIELRNTDRKSSIIKLNNMIVPVGYHGNFAPYK